MDFVPDFVPLDRNETPLEVGQTVAYATLWIGGAHLRVGRIKRFRADRWWGEALIRGEHGTSTWKPCEELLLLPSSGASPAGTAADQLAGISKELHSMALSPAAQALADRLDAATAKAKQELADALAQDDADVSGLTDHVAALEAALAVAPTQPPAAG